MKGESSPQAGGRGMRDASLWGVLSWAVVILILGLPEVWQAPWMVSTKAKEAVSQERVVRVEVRGPYELEGIHKVPQGTRVGAFLEGLGASRESWGRPSEVWERPVEDLMSVTLMDGAQERRVHMEPMSPGRAFLLGDRLDLNRASIRELTLLPGIGPATARKIAMNRRALGPFSSPEDLRRVRGISSRVVDGILPLVTTQDGKDPKETRNSKHEIRNKFV